jgi:hypothetical protein
LAPAAKAKSAGLATKLIAWQGMLLTVPDAWDLTGFSGGSESGYFRVDDGGEMAVEVKWATEPQPKRGAAVAPPDVDVRRESYLHLLQRNAKKKKLTIQTHETDAPRGVLRPDRDATGFRWTSDRRATGAVWHCATCRRTVIVQLLGPASGKGGFAGVADAILSAIRCHGEDPEWRTWALYDLRTEVPADYRLESQELMNVYLRLTFARKTARLTIEQWSLANVARRNSYLDVWLAANSRSPELNAAKYQVDATELHGHPAITLAGRVAFGAPTVQVVRDALQVRRPATRFSGVAWECDAANKLFALSELRPGGAPATTALVAARTRCHTPRSDEVAP